MILKYKIVVPNTKNKKINNTTITILSVFGILFYTIAIIYKSGYYPTGIIFTYIFYCISIILAIIFIVLFYVSLRYKLYNKTDRFILFGEEKILIKNGRNEQKIIALSNETKINLIWAVTQDQMILIRGVSAPTGIGTTTSIIEIFDKEENVIIYFESKNSDIGRVKKILLHWKKKGVETSTTGI